MIPRAGPSDRAFRQDCQLPAHGGDRLVVIAGSFQANRQIILRIEVFDCGGRRAIGLVMSQEIALFDIAPGVPGGAVSEIALVDDVMHHRHPKGGPTGDLWDAIRRTDQEGAPLNRQRVLKSRDGRACRRTQQPKDHEPPNASNLNWFSIDHAVLRDRRSANMIEEVAISPLPTHTATSPHG